MDNVYQAIEQHIKQDPVEAADGLERMEQMASTLDKQVEITKDLASVIDGFQDNEISELKQKALEKWERYIHIEDLPLESANDALIGELYRIIYTTNKRAL
jgi:hypothetical protein